MPETQPVLILGAGINGAAVARELALNGVPVWVVDANDIAFGATARSSRLIHGGLRYLEYGDFQLVRESLEERARLSAAAPQFIEPLRLYIPVRRRLGGLIRSVLRFLGGARRRVFQRWAAAWPGAKTRGLWLVRLGLWFYDRLAADKRFPKHRAHRAATVPFPKLDAVQFPWLCSYSDAQMQYPERFVLALLEDARKLAEQNGTEFRVFTYHRVRLRDGVVEIRPARNEPLVAQLRPPVVINATGAWGDFTLEELGVPAPRLFGGTKGSHFVTYNPRLRDALDGAGVYAEADDGRLVFVLPFGQGVLVGTTDERFDDRPENAVATEPELTYLLQMVNDLFPAAGLTRDDIALHYSGVRPLPNVSAGTSAAIPRGHAIDVHTQGALPVLTLIGGKLTTCRAFAEEVADAVFARLGIARIADTRARSLPGGENYPSDRASLEREWQRLAAALRLEQKQVQAVWSLCGTRTEAILRECLSQSEMHVPSAEFPATTGKRLENLHGTNIPLAYARWVTRHEWVMTLDDLIQRRLMLLYQPDLTEACLRQLADCLVESNRLSLSDIDAAVALTIARLRTQYGKAVAGAVSASIPAEYADDRR
jgi:glycerol-3-phosphate dehydrogenase